MVSECPSRAVMYNGGSMGELLVETDCRILKCQNFQVTFSKDVLLIFTYKPSYIVEFEAFVVMKISVRVI
jgi:hypothetical protein